jgi:mannose-6-phosphate isomerase-like protein (cupin superfamily)
MLIKNVKESESGVVKYVHNGKGEQFGGRIFDRKDFESDWDFVDWWKIPRGSSTGGHKHEGTEELYFIVKGKGEMTLNGTKKSVSEGDCILTKSGESHGLVNNSDEDILLFVVQVSLRGRKKI